jgi:MFS family permease
LATVLREAQPASLERRHIAAVTLGNALEFYDFLTYSFFAIQIGHAFFPSRSGYVSLMLSLATFFAGFATRPIGGFVIGSYADRAGRRPAMLLSFMLMGTSILAMALIPSYAVIGIVAPILAVLARMMQGFSLGGELGSNTAFLMEAVAPEHRGFSVSWQGASQCAALFCGSLVGLLLTNLLPAPLLDTYGWRIAFLLGAVTVPFGLWLRTSLPETLHASEQLSPTAHVSLGSEPANRLNLARRNWRIMILGLIVLGAATIGNYIAIYIVTFAQASLHLSARVGFIAESCNTLIAIPSVLLGGWLSDRFGRRPVNICNGALLFAMIYPLFHWIVATRSPVVLTVAMTILGISLNFAFGSFLATLGESLPKTIRVTGLATVYSLAIGIMGGSTQFVVTWLIHVSGSAMAPAWYWVTAAGIGELALLLVPESAPAHVRVLPAGAAVMAG